MNAPEKIVQGSDAWLQSRLGKATGSRIGDVMAKIKAGEAAARRDYRTELVAEILTGKSTEFFVTADMRWGTDCEPLARAAYEAEMGVIIEETGLVDHPTIPMSGASPDGLVGSDGLIEMKCPKTATHIKNIFADEAPSEYVPQMQWEMVCTGRKWCDFVSFDPRLPPDMQLFIKRVHRDDKVIAEYEAEVIKFNKEVEDTVAKLIAIRRQQGEPA